MREMRLFQKDEIQHLKVRVTALVKRNRKLLRNDEAATMGYDYVHT
jgi:hypothetical protein